MSNLLRVPPRPLGYGGNHCQVEASPRRLDYERGTGPASLTLIPPTSTWARCDCAHCALTRARSRSSLPIRSPTAVLAVRRLAQALSPDHDLVTDDAPGTRRIRVDGDVHVRRPRRRPHRATQRAPVAARGVDRALDGGAHVTAVAAAAAERVRALVLEDPHWPGGPAPVPRSRGRARPRCRAQHPS
jgi:hypothetical protein